MKIINYLMMALFAYAAIVQLNDPDPIAWVLVYAGAMAFCGLWIMNELPTTFAFVFACACLLTGLLLLTRAFTQEVWLRDETLSESAGLLLVFIWVSSLAWLAWKQDGQATLT